MATEKTPTPPPPKKKRPALQLSQSLTVTKRVGRGRLGVVYAAVHSVLARRFAVKVLRGELTPDDVIVRRLRQTVRDASLVEHAAVIALSDFGQIPDGRVYITMDFVRGTSLAEILEREGRLPVLRAVPILLQLAEALGAAHRLRVVHGDLKPNNILVQEEVRGFEAIKIHDFALSQTLANLAPREEEHGHLRRFGSVDYLAPEQINRGHIDGRTDVYCFGALAYRVLTGEPPFVGTPEEVVQAHRTRDPVPPSRRSGAHTVPADLDSLILHCLEKQANDRFRSMEELAWELQGLAPEFDEESTGRWEMPDEGLEISEEPLPESPGRVRRLFYDTIFELAELLAKREVGTDAMGEGLGELARIRGAAATTAGEVELAENRFEDIRRELRERESTLRYALIDLNLARTDNHERGGTAEALSDLEFQIGQLEQSLVALETQRRERFAALNDELQQQRAQVKAMEHQMVVHYRRLYSELSSMQSTIEVTDANPLYRLLDRCRDALAQPGSGSSPAVALIEPPA